MKKTFSSTMMFLVLAAMTLTVSVNAEASKKKTATKTKHLQKVTSTKRSPIGTGKSAASNAGKSLSTDVVFDGSMVNGRYHTAGEAVATVETEKKMNELVGFRRDFKDRLVVERARLRGQ